LMGSLSPRVTPHHIVLGKCRVVRHSKTGPPNAAMGHKRPWFHVGSNVWFARKETSTAVIRVSDVTECRSASFQVDVRGPNRFAPLLGFFGDERAEACGRVCEHHPAEDRESAL